MRIPLSTCHWCHVMERESFEDEEIAAILNKNFVSIKVDREERPDVDHIYMTVCQALTGHGGWPLTIFMAPDKKPFYAGTYFPKHDRMGMPGLITLLNRIAGVWKNSRDELVESGNKIIDAIKAEHDIAAAEPDENLIHNAFSEFKYDFDSVYGGFGSAPKFPTPHNLYYLLRYWYVAKNDTALDMVERTLDSMHRGGIYDHIGFGFSRYSTDKKWLVPHFEKMLYDNALLAIAYLETYQATKKEKYAEIARQIFTYVLRDMTSKDGGFFSAEDADSEGEEGKFYIWTVDEVKQVLGEEDGEKFCSYFDITPKGNFEGHNIPNLIKARYPEEEKSLINKYREKLFEHREKRIHPYKDDKILTAWNGLMIAAMAAGGRILGDGTYSRAAERAADFISTKLIREDGRLMARYRDNEAAYPGYVDDYSFLIWGLIELYETTYKPEYLEKALKLNDDLLKLFWDEEHGGLFVYGSDSEQLITRPKEVYDGATPSGNSVAALNFLRLARLTGRQYLEEKALQQFKTFGSSLERVARGHAFLLTAFMYTKTNTKEIVLVSNEARDSRDEMLEILKEEFRPFTLSMLYSKQFRNLESIAPFITSYKTVENKTTAYVCENFACQAPITDSAQFRNTLAH